MFSAEVKATLLVVLLEVVHHNALDEKSACRYILKLVVAIFNRLQTLIAVCSRHGVFGFSIRIHLYSITFFHVFMCIQYS